MRCHISYLQRHVLSGCTLFAKVKIIFRHSITILFGNLTCDPGLILIPNFNDPFEIFMGPLQNLMGPRILDIRIIDMIFK